MFWQHSFLAVLFLASVCVAKITEEDGVLVLTKDNFDEAIAKHKYILVEFYAPWCGHCKALAPEYKKAAQVLANEGSEIKLAKVDATVESELASKHNVQGYPTLKYFRDGKPKEYRGGRDADGIVSWCKAKMGPSLQEVASVDEAKKFIDSRDVVVLLFAKDAESPAKAIVERLADGIEDISFAFSVTPQVLQEYGIKKDSEIVLFKKFDDGKTIFEGELNEEALKKFCETESVPLIFEFDQATSYKVFGSPIKKHVVSFLSKANNYQSYVDKLTPAAQRFKGKVHFIVIDVDVEDHLRILEFFGMTKDDVPAYRLIDLSEEMIKYKPDTQDFSVDHVAAFIQNGLDGKLKPFLMSQKLPDDWDANPVKVLVGSNFNDVTKDKSKGVFVELYAPWCGHCKALSPIWEDLGEAYKNSKDVIIAKMDATANEAEGLKVGSFPTLKYYPKNSDEVIDYSGDRTFEALKKFVDSEGKMTVKEKKDEDEDTGDHAKDEL